MAHTVVALYDDLDTAHRVVRDLRDAGVPNSKISLVAHDAAGEYSRFTGRRGEAETSDGAATGAGVGALVGGLGGLLVGLGALTIPGIGPIIAAGPLGTALAALLGAGAGALAGGVAGGLIGALVDMGIPEEEAGYYAEGVRRGSALVAVDADDPMRDRVRDIMNRFQPVDINERAAHWRQAGWKGYDTTAQPYTREQVMREREQYRARPQPGQVRMYPATGRAGTADYERYAPGFRGHYQTHFARSGYKYEHYEPAYQYGLSLRNDPRYRDYDWNRLEPEARRTWEQRYPGTAWDQIRDAVRHAWENVKAAVRD